MSDNLVFGQSPPLAVTEAPVAASAIASGVPVIAAAEPVAVMSEAVVPEAVVPEAVVPEAVVPEAVVPEAVVPDAVVPEVLPQRRRSGWIIAGLCALLGFALVLQVRQTTTDQLSTLRQDDLVRLLEGVSTRSDQLEAEVERLEAIRADLLSGSDQAQVAREIARQRAATEGILSGRLPAQGPGITLTISDPNRDLAAADLFNLLEELRNAGAEAIQVGNYRVVTSTAFTDGGIDIFLDGNVLPQQLEWIVIGDPATLERALEIPGGALPRIRAAGATTEIDNQQEIVVVSATATIRDSQYARPIADV